MFTRTSELSCTFDQFVKTVQLNWTKRLWIDTIPQPEELVSNLRTYFQIQDHFQSIQKNIRAQSLTDERHGI